MAALLISLCLVSSFHDRFGQGWVSKTWNLFSMIFWDCRISNGYFIDKANHIKFKLPSDTYGVGVYGGGSSGHLDLMWYRNANLYNGDYLTKIYWFKKSGEEKNIIENAMKFEITMNNIKMPESFSEVTIEINELNDTKYGLQGHLRYSRSLANNTRITNDMRFFFKNGFLVTVNYTATKNNFENIKSSELNSFSDNFITTFSAN